MWKNALDYFQDNLLIRHCLISLDKFSKEKRWRNYKIEDYLSIVNSIGIGVSFFYGYTWIEAHIVDYNNNQFIDRRGKEWAALKEDGLIRLYIEVNNLFDTPEYPVHTLNRLLKVVERNFADFQIFGNKIELVQTNDSKKVAELFLKLCDIIFRERVRCHNDIKKYYNEIGFKKQQ